MSESLTDASYNRRTSSDYSGSDGIQTTCTSDDQEDDNARYMVIAYRIVYNIVLVSINLTLPFPLHTFSLFLDARRDRRSCNYRGIPKPKT